jgi:hypothetical protein
MDLQLDTFDFNTAHESTNLPRSYFDGLVM